MERRKWGELTPRMQKALSIGAFIFFIIFSALLFVSVGVPMIRYAKNPDLFREWIDSMGVWGKLAYVGMNVLQVLVAVIPGGPLELAGGYAFGHLMATILSILGITIGSSLVFLLVRLFGHKLVEAFFPIEKINEVKFLRSPRSRKLLLGLLFLIPGTPKDLLCYFCGLTDISFFSFVTITNLARIPAIWASSYGGSSVGDKSYFRALLILLAVLICTLVGVGIYLLIVRRHQKKGREKKD